MLRDPGYRPPDRGLLARVKVLGQLLEDSWVFTVATLLHVGFFGIELGAVLCKVLTSVPSAYAVMLAGEEYANEVETANRVFRRIGSQEAPEQELGGMLPPEPDAPAPGDAGAALPEPPSNDDGQSDEASDTAARLEDGVRLAKVQAATRAKAQEKSRTPKDAEKAAEPPEGDDADRRRSGRTSAA